MQLLRSVAVVAFAALAAAQSTSLGFTQVPSAVKAGQATIIKYDAPDNDPVTITLRRGDPNNLDTVATLTSDANGGSYTWIPGNSYEDGDDYALQIEQGREINYSGAITISGSNAAAVSSAKAATASLSSVGAQITSSFAQSQSVASIQSILASYSSALQNLTATSETSTTTSGTGVVSPLVTGTGTGIARNGTMVTPTLTSTETDTASQSSSSGQSSSTSSTTSAALSSSSGAASPIQLGSSSPLALVAVWVAGLLL